MSWMISAVKAPGVEPQGLARRSERDAAARFAAGRARMKGFVLRGPTFSRRSA